MSSHKMPYKRQPAGTPRPFRVWDAQKRKHVPGRCYKHERHAHDGALLIARWSKVDEVLEVYDVSTGRLIGQYKRMERGVSFTNVSLRS